MLENDYCKDCANFRGYSNEGYWCNIDKADVDKYDSCKCFDSNKE